jgi:UV DNA damage endonuclease
MKIGYACINQSLECRSSRTFRLKTYSEIKLIETIEGNLNCLLKILKFNRENKILFFRITSDLIPFASHSIMKFNWQNHFKSSFEEIGKYIKDNQMRITMHPGQYTVLNTQKSKVLSNSILDLNYHTDVLDLLNLDKTAKIQIHGGGVYGDKNASIKRFIKRYEDLDERIKDRLIIENDDISYSFKDVHDIYTKTDIPIVFDIYHHECNNSGETLLDALKLTMTTWKENDGNPIVHYSSEHPAKGKCRHADTINIKNFRDFLELTKEYIFDIMLEIKDKEQSALKAIKELKNLI